MTLTSKNGSGEIGYHPNLHLHYGDMSDFSVLQSLLASTQPEEFYNLAAQSHVRISFDLPLYTAEATGIGSLNALEAIRSVSPDTKYYQASSSEMFGASPPPQNESTRFHPRSPYGVSKVFSYWTTVNYRESYGLFAANGILFNHESPRRGENFVTRKIAKAAVEIDQGKRDFLYLGNLEAVRDWGYAPEYVGAMWRMLQQDTPSDFVIATGIPATVIEFAEYCFSLLGMRAEEFIRFDSRLLRPAEVDSLIGDSSRARETLGWKPLVGVRELARIMVEAEQAAANSGVCYEDTPEHWGLN